MGLGLVPSWERLRCNTEDGNQKQLVTDLAVNSVLSSPGPGMSPGGEYGLPPMTGQLAS